MMVHPRLSRHFAGPTLATSGLALQVPIAIVSDALLKHPVWIQSSITIVCTLVGGAIIVAAFFGLNLKDLKEEEEEEECKTRQEESRSLFSPVPTAD